MGFHMESKKKILEISVLAEIRDALLRPDFVVFHKVVLLIQNVKKKTTGNN
jgi:hypothetical protein